MGDCSEVFIGLTQYFIHAINRNADIDKLNRFEIHIYTDDVRGNVLLANADMLKKVLF